MRFCYWLAATIAFAQLICRSDPSPAPVTLVASGAGLGGTADEFEAKTSLMSGDFDVRVRVESLSRADVWSEAGLIAHEAGSTSARFAAAVCTPSISGCLFKSRVVAGQNATGSGSFPVNYPGTWLRLRRTGASFTGYGSFDGTNWVKLGSASFAAATELEVGIFAASHAASSTQAVFSHFEAVGPEAVAVSGVGIEPVAQSSRLTGLVISEIMYHPAARTDGRRLEFIELLNTLATPADISGYEISGDADFRFPGGTTIPGGGFLVVARNPADLEAVYGISGVLGPFDGNLPNDTGVVRVRNRQNAILLEVEYGSRFPWPSEPDGNGPSLILTSPSLGEGDAKAWSASATEGGTPGAINTRIASQHTVPSGPSGVIVFNEIMYHPISEDDDDQYVELFNRGDRPVDLSGSSLDDGVQFTFPPGTVLAPGGYLVIARNVDRVRTNNPGLKATNTLGNFSGRLSRSGERLVLRDAVGSLLDEVTYADGGAWGEWSDGLGSSLEKIDPRADSRYPSNWADSDETTKAGWTTVSVTGRLDNGNVPADQLQVLLQGAGECVIDDVKVLDAFGANLVFNSTFDNHAASWVAEGTQKNSRWEPAEAGGAYHIVAVARGDNQINRVRTGLTSPIAANNAATISARVRWLKGSPFILFRLRGNWLEAPARMELPKNLGTPGAPNSRFVGNAGPAIADVRHSPVLPEANEPVIVTARVSDPDGVRRVILRYRIDPAPGSTGMTMVDDGTNGDNVAGDGVFTGVIPGQSAGTLAAFEVVAQDVNDALTTFPPFGSRRECLVRFGEEMPRGNFPVYRIWMTEATLNEWINRHKLDNTPLNVTFVYGNSRAIYGAQALYAGSPYIAPGYFSPAGGRCGYTISFPSDDRFLGDTDLILDWPGGHGGERTGLQEQMAYWLAEQMELPYSHRYHIRLFVNGVSDMERGTVFEAVNQPASDFLEAWMPNDSDGDFYKIDRAFEFSDSGSLIADPQPRLQNYTTTGGAKKTARYRWTWMKRASNDPHNYTNIFNLVDAVNAAAPEPYTSATESLVDIEEWMGMFAFEHIIVNFDAYGHEIGKNMYAYKPLNGKWQLYAFDLDWLMLAAARRGDNYAAGSAPLYNAEDPTIRRMYNHPPFRRAYLRAVKRAVEGPMLSAQCDPVMDAKYESLLANGITMCDGQTLTGPAVVKTWFAQRRAYLVSQLAEGAAPFAITSNSGSDFSTNSPVVTLTGTAPIEAKTIRVNGSAFPIDWTTLTGWEIPVVLASGSNELTLSAIDENGALVAEDHITITGSFIAPRLSIEQAGDFLRLSWPVSALNYAIESSEDLAIWSAVQRVESANSLEIAASSSRRFYRLRLAAGP